MVLTSKEGQAVLRVRVRLVLQGVVWGTLKVGVVVAGWAGQVAVAVRVVAGGACLRMQAVLVWRGSQGAGQGAALRAVAGVSQEGAVVISLSGVVFLRGNHKPTHPVFSEGGSPSGNKPLHKLHPLARHGPNAWIRFGKSGFARNHRPVRVG